MERPWFACQPVDESFLDTAPLRLRGTFDIPRPAAEVWDELTAEHPLLWCRILQDITWTSPRPFGVGTTRTVVALGGLNVFKERFFRWEEGRRHSFVVEQASAPMFRRFAEDYLVEPAGADACRFAWTIAGEARPGFGLTTPGNRLLLKTLLTDTARHYGLR
jgi:hypothetical protein